MTPYAAARSYTPNDQCAGDGRRGPRHLDARRCRAIKMFMSPCPTSTTAPNSSACRVRSDAALAARSRAALKLSTPSDQPQNHAERAIPAHISGGRRSPDRNPLGNSASRKHGSMSGTAAGASSCAESRERRSGLAARHDAARLSCSSSGLGRGDPASGASASPRSHSANAWPAIGVRKSHAGLPCRASTILITPRSPAAATEP